MCIEDSTMKIYLVIYSPNLNVNNKIEGIIMVNFLSLNVCLKTTKCQKENKTISIKETLKENVANNVDRPSLRAL